jgi:predicted metal-dependent hydrolase
VLDIVRGPVHERRSKQLLIHARLWKAVHTLKRTRGIRTC